MRLAVRILFVEGPALAAGLAGVVLTVLFLGRGLWLPAALTGLGLYVLTRGYLRVRRSLRNSAR